MIRDLVSNIYIYIYIYISEKGGKALKQFPHSLRLPKGGLRWINTSEIGGVING